MLNANIRGLRVATALIDGAPDVDAASVSAAQLASMIARTEAALPRFPIGTPQRSLLRNRLSALRFAQALVGEP